MFCRHIVFAHLESRGLEGKDDAVEQNAESPLRADAFPVLQCVAVRTVHTPEHSIRFRGRHHEQRLEWSADELTSSSGFWAALAGFQAGPPQAPIYSAGSLRPQADVGVKQCVDFDCGQLPPQLGQSSERLLWCASELIAEFRIGQETAYESFDNSV